MSSTVASGRKTTSGYRVAVAASLAMSLPFDAAAQGRHPHYLRARADLRRSILLMRIPEEPNVMRDMNAAAGLVAAGLAGDLKEGVALGAEAIDSGQAALTLAKLQQFGKKHADA